MKKLIALSLLFLGIQGIAYSDTVTSGVVGLTVITPGSIDTSKSWGTKINENTTWISTAITNVNSTLVSSINYILQGGATTYSDDENVVVSTNNLQDQINAISGAGSGAGGQLTLFLHIDTETVGSTIYELLLSTPADGTEELESVIVNSASGLVMLDSHTTLMGGMGVGRIPAGEFIFRTYAYVDSSVGDTDIVIKVSTMASDGTGKTELFQSTTPEINSTSVERFLTAGYLIEDVVINSTSDRLVFDYYARTTSVSNRTVYLVYDGKAHQSNCRTTIAQNATFTSLDDTPSSYFDAKGKLVVVNSTGVIFENHIDSITVYGTITSTTGFIVNSATITNLNTNSIFTASMTSYGAVISTSGFVGGGSTFTTVYADSYLGNVVTSVCSATYSLTYNLIVTTVGTDTNQIYVSIEKINILEEYYTNISTVVDMSKIGAGGMDQAELPSTWYQGWAFSNGSTVTIVLSSYSNTSPSLPSGYTKMYPYPLFSVRNNASSNIIPFKKSGGITKYWTQQLVADQVDYDSETQIDLQNYIPANSTSLEYAGYVQNSAEGVVNPGQIIKMKGNVGATIGGAAERSMNYGIYQAGDTLTLGVVFWTASLNVFDSRTMLIRDDYLSSNGTSITIISYTEDRR